MSILDFEHEDDEWEVRREFEQMELERAVEEDGEDEHEVDPGRRGRRTNSFIENECGVSKIGRDADDL